MYKDGQKVYEKMFNLNNHQGNKTQNHNETLLHSCQNGLFSTRQETTSVGKDVEQENFITLLLGIKLQTLWKTVWRFLKKLKIELLHDPNNNNKKKA